ncbi:hypothetical protein EDF77_2505 [Stenotrophomonas maltophilia]|jgi:hypothetical protein|uniref:hypothetical protein n=1 Tax=Stenotrophomonas chelatiphaga TaxID=517011 RepID=UPI000FBFD656|nr:hypothetical protein [Stenotrophomonas chelatiphaga]MCS4230679.1 hypothetical protein [Stenotrophomonas chelatiphaga]ROQ40174.1 hypothetical protein EDF77_2505 [Stenotrophomonas maltophilia]
MNPVAAATSSSSSTPWQEAGRPLSLSERVLAHGQQAAARGDAGDPGAGDGEGELIPLPKPIWDMETAIRAWSRQTFIESMMSEDEEVTGIPALSIDI